MANAGNRLVKPMKCKQCREVVMDNFDEIIISGHGEKLDIQDKDICGSSDTVWYLNVDRVPIWIKDRINEDAWVKGRLNCPKCDARIGSFDFKKGSKCDCSKFVLPGASIIQSKVDV